MITVGSSKADTQTRQARDSIEPPPPRHHDSRHPVRRVLTHSARRGAWPAEIRRACSGVLQLVDRIWNRLGAPGIIRMRATSLNDPASPARQSKRRSQAAGKDAAPFMLGGDHSVTYPILRSFGKPSTARERALTSMPTAISTTSSTGTDTLTRVAGPGARGRHGEAPRQIGIRVQRGSARRSAVRSGGDRDEGTGTVRRRSSTTRSMSRSISTCSSRDFVGSPIPSREV
jgi:hypothetical protein